KALSNQKFGDFVRLHGAESTGLLTGDNSINGDASIVVMTTEVLRNMIYEDSDALSGLRYVVLDEVHYLQDRYRGAVWEEILIHLPVDVRIVSLSATVSNAEEFAEWLQTLRGRTEVIIEERRPVDIRHWYFASNEMLPMFVRRQDGDITPNPRGREFDRRKRSVGGQRPRRGGKRPPAKRARIPWRTEVVERLDSEDMLPAIYFIFSRKGCAEAVRQCLREGLRLTDGVERDEIVEYADARVADLSPAELDILGYPEWIAGLERGIAAHHAGMIPPFKEVVEELFGAGLVKVVFATETLALGINMPARSVVIESLMKFTGEKHELMTPGQFTQLSGRAGRRGKDVVGNAVVLLQRFTAFDAITRLASTRTYPLRSSFLPSYNMAVNLVRNYDLAEAEHLVNSSFAQFQSDRGVVKLEVEREEKAAYLASYRERATCDLGDVEGYRALVHELKNLEGKKRSARARAREVNETMTRLSPGDLIEVTAGKKRGRYAVIEVHQRRSEKRPRILALTKQGGLIRLTPADLPEPPRQIGRLSLQERHRISDPAERRELGKRIRSFVITENGPEDDELEEQADEIEVLRRAVQRHPVAKCPEVGRHLHFADLAARLQKRVASIDRSISRSTSTLARRFDQVLSVLEKLDYVVDWTLTPKGETLTGIYNESDLLVVETVESGMLD
ncbi:MAG TPA: DEAD/DEAH box helicase, partial [Actinomycetota bacterium]|nr:DEAD/DEAH box helicase [Actinomycetota bacterium]